MSPSPSPSPPRRLAVLRSHLIPDPAPPAADGERRRAAAVAVSTSACAGSGSSGPSEGKSPAGEEVIAGMCSKVPFLSNAIMKATQCDSFNLVVNNGAAAGQVIFHTHFHIIPRRAGDKLWPSESFIRRSIEQNQETLDLVSCIKEQLYSSSGEYKTEASLIPKML